MNEGILTDRRMLFRIGINLGGILIEGNAFRVTASTSRLEVGTARTLLERRKVTDALVAKHGDGL